MTFFNGNGTPPNLTQILNVLQNLVVATNAQTPSAATFLPYVGATANVDTGSFSISTKNLTATGTISATGHVTFEGVTSTGATGTGKLVFATTPTLVTPVLGAATATSINFGGTSLANYVEGTWTPAITTSGTVGTPAYSIQVGSYTRIGRIVVAQFSITLSGWTGSPTGNVAISGLPLASTSTTNDNAVCSIASYSVTGLASLNYGVSGLIIPSAMQIALLSQGNTGTSSITAAQAGTTASFVGNCIYHG